MMNIKKIFGGMKLRLMLRNYQSSAITLPSGLINIKNVLVCLPPDQRELTMIKGFLPEISKIFASSEIYLLASPSSTIYDIFPRKGYRIMTPTPSQVSWHGLATASYIKLLKKISYDLIFDLNLRSNSFTRSILLSFPEAIKIGRSNSLGTPYYNIEIKTKYIRDEKNIYKSMIQTIDRLKNPPPVQTSEGAE